MGNSVIYRPAYDAEVEYLESDGNQKIMTDFIPDNTCGISVRFNKIESATNCIIVGAGSATDDTRWWINAANSVEICWNTWIGYTTTTLDTWYEVTNNFLNSRIGTIDSVTKRTDYPTLNEVATPARIFWANSKLRISNVKFSRGSEIVMDFIPVRIGSVGYMYDKVSKQLFDNKGTGNFVLGADKSNVTIQSPRCVIYSPMYDAQVEYLESTGTQWIDTNVIPASGWKIEVEYMVTRMECFIFGSRTAYQSSDAFSSYMDPLGIYIQYDGNQERINGVGTSLNHRYKLIMSADGAFLDDVKIRDANSNTFNCPCNLYLFAKNQPDENGSDRSFKGYIYHCKVWDNNTLVRDFIPVRIGSTGYMFDKVSKRLFANKGSGNFVLGSDVIATVPKMRCVEGGAVYREYKWLCGRNGAYIDTNHPLTTYDDAFYIKARWDGTVRNPSSNEQNIFGYTHLNNNTITDICRLYINSSGRISCNYYIPDGNWNSLPNSLGLTDIEVYSYAVGNNHYVNLNDTLHTLSTNGMQQQTFGSFIALFSNNGDDDNGERLRSRYFHGDIASFRITDPTFTIDKVNMVPCKLLQDIPAYMDGNNIARSAGTCGMWDKVSNKFYGNVADKGTFTVEGDGVYREYDYLVVPYTRDTANILPIESNNINFKYIFYSFGNIGGLWTTNGKYAYYPNSGKNGIWGVDENTVVYAGDKNPLITPVEINCSSSGITMDGQSMPNYGTSPYFSQLKLYCYSEGSEYAISGVTVDNILRYVPCKLIQDIPSSVDANSIPRQAGTCGMWDRVNNKFYGNIASRGTFTVINEGGVEIYKEYKWLRITMNKGDDVIYYLPINSDNFKFTTIIESGNNVGHFNASSYWYYTASNTNSNIAIWDTVNRVVKGTSTDVGSNQMLFESSETDFKVNGISITKYGFPVNNLLIYSKAADLSKLISAITINDVISYVPVQLLKNLPPSKDANGIERYSGECGFWDKINNKFYGNVSGFGTFTVSND